MNDEEKITNQEQGDRSKIVNAAMYIDALKSSGYKSTYNAIAEIVDNSIDAEATDVLIIGEQKAPAGSEKRIVSFGFLDNGNGMDFDTLKGCLTIGFTTNHERKGMGRFGVGLPQASIFVCDRVEVYSWQEGIENCKMVYIDVGEVREKNLNEIADPVSSSIPNEYRDFIKWQGENRQFDFSAHGTLVIWKKCTAVDHKKWSTCVDHMSEDLGRKYRYFLANRSKHIYMIEMVSKTETEMLPNDPLYLITPGQECVPSDIDKFIEDGYKSKPYDESSGYTESMFEPYKPTETDTGEVTLNVKYEVGEELKTGQVKVKYSIIKKKYYSKTDLKTETKPGSLSYGKSWKLNNNIGISIVRNGREIDFGSFGFFNYYNVPEYRWWGIEISFNSDMDTAFGISNNKQNVNLKPMSKQEMAEVLVGEPKTLWHQLADEIIPTIDKMTNRNSSIRNEEMKDDNPIPSESSQIVNKVDEEEDLTGIDDVELIPDEQKEEEAREQLINEGTEEPTETQIQKLIDSKVRVQSVFNKGKNDSFVDISYAAGTLCIILNANHSFYTLLVEKILEDENTKVPFELFLIAVMKSVKKQAIEDPNGMDKLMFNINNRITKYMMGLVNQND